MKSVISDHHLNLMKNSIVKMIENEDLDILTSRMIKERLQAKYENYDIQKNKNLINQMIRDEYDNFFKKDSNSGITAGQGKIGLIQENGNNKILEFKELSPELKKQVYKIFKNNTIKVGKEENKDIELDIYDDSYIYFRYDGLDEYDIFHQLMLVNAYGLGEYHSIEVDGERYTIYVEDPWDEGELPTGKPEYHYSYKYTPNEGQLGYDLHQRQLGYDLQLVGWLEDYDGTDIIKLQKRINELGMDIQDIGDDEQIDHIIFELDAVKRAILLLQTDSKNKKSLKSKVDKIILKLQDRQEEIENEKIENE